MRTTKPSKSERTRDAILEAAEGLFSESGFDRTSLDAIGERAGILGTAILYHFPNKRALYEAVVSELFGGMFGSIREALEAPGRPLANALEDAIESFLEYVWARPAAAHILLQEAARRGDHSQAFRALARPAMDYLRAFLEKGQRTGELRPITTGPEHFASMVIGSTIFFVGALPSLLPSLPYDPLSREQLEAHKRDLLRVTRRLLGLRVRT